VKRWLALALGLVIAALALYVLASSGGDEPAGRIDAASRARLERVLEEADREAVRR
jgi:hypothetical protein